MGLPRFWARWLRRHRQIFLPFLSGAISGFAIDGNGILYEVAARVYNMGSSYTPEAQAILKQKSLQQLEKEFFDLLAIRITEICARFAPRDHLIFAYDGRAPKPKQDHQRQRRFRSMLENYPGKENFDTNQFSPGTELMNKVNAFTEKHLQTLWAESFSGTHTFARKVIYSGTDVPGEGEHKIMEIYRNQLVDTSGAQLIYGMDADLAVLALALKKKNFYLVRSDKLDERGLEILSIDLLTEQILEKLETDDIDEFVALVCLIGNDFIPAPLGLSVIPHNLDALTDCYKKMNYRLTDKGEIQLAGLRELLMLLSARETELYQSLAEYDQYPFTTLSPALAFQDLSQPAKFFDEPSVKNIKVTVDLPLLRKLWYRQWGAGDVQIREGTITCTLGGGFNALTPLEGLLDLNQLTSAENWAQEIAADYWAMYRWMISYYLVGQSSVNWNLTYPHFRAPLLPDLLTYLESLESWPNFNHRMKEANVGKVSRQMISILPNRNLLPSALAKAAFASFPDLYVSNYYVVTDGSFAFSADRLPDQSITLIPGMDPDRLATGLMMKEEKPEKEGNLIVFSPDEESAMQKVRTQLVMKATVDPKILRKINFARNPVKAIQKPLVGKEVPAAKISEVILGKTDSREVAKLYQRFAKFYRWIDLIMRQVDKFNKNKVKELISKHMIYLLNGFPEDQTFAMISRELAGTVANYPKPEIFREEPMSETFSLEVKHSELIGNRDVQFTVTPSAEHLPFLRRWIVRPEYERIKKYLETPEKAAKLLLSYELIIPTSSAQNSLPNSAKKVLQTYGITYKCFAKPGDAEVFYSLFPEVDGSLGNFFTAELSPGLYDCFPPWYPEFVQFTWAKIIKYVERQEPFGFLCVFPLMELSHPAIAARFVLSPSRYILQNAAEKDVVQNTPGQIIFITNRQVPWIQSMMTNLENSLNFTESSGPLTKKNI